MKLILSFNIEIFAPIYRDYINPFNSAACESNEDTCDNEPEIVSGIGATILDNDTASERNDSNNTDYSERVLVYERVRSDTCIKDEHTPIDKDNLYDLEISSLHKKLEYHLQCIRTNIYQINKDLYPKTLINEQQKEKLRPMFKQVLDESKFETQCEFHKHILKTSQKIFNRLPKLSSPDCQKASISQTVGLDWHDICLPLPIQEYVDKFYDIVEIELLQLLHSRTSSVSPNMRELYNTVIDFMIKGITQFLLDINTDSERDDNQTDGKNSRSIFQSERVLVYDRVNFNNEETDRIHKHNSFCYK